MLISVVFGTVVGAVAGYYGGWIGAVLMRIVDAILCFPSVFLLLALAAFIKPSVPMITVIIAATAWMEVARVVAEPGPLPARARLRRRGPDDRRLGRHHHVPRAGPQRHRRRSSSPRRLTVARAILMESYISFLGYGIQPPMASWGNMLNNAQQYLVSAPWLAIFPGLMITLAVASFNFVGDGLRDALDARLDLH